MFCPHSALVVTFAFENKPLYNLRIDWPFIFSKFRVVQYKFKGTVPNNNVAIWEKCCFLIVLKWKPESIHNSGDLKSRTGLKIHWR